MAEPGTSRLPKALNRISPSARTLVSLRDPADRCWSWFQFVKSRTRIPKEMTFTAYLDRCEELHGLGLDGTRENQPFWGLGGGCYATYLEAWVAEFGDRSRIVFFDDVVHDTRGSIKEICEWLALDTRVVDDFQFSVSNKTEQYRHRWAQRAAVTVNRRGERFFHRHDTAKRLLRVAYYSANKAPASPRMSHSERTRLAVFYRPHNARLSVQLAVLGLAMPASWSRPAGSHGRRHVP